MKTPAYFTPVRIVFWFVMIGILITFALGVFLFPKGHRGTDLGMCVMNQRNLQQAVRSHQYHNDLKPGDPIDWTEIIGPDLLIESAPECPTHGFAGRAVCSEAFRPFHGSGADEKPGGKRIRGKTPALPSAFLQQTAEAVTTNSSVPTRNLGRNPKPYSKRVWMAAWQRRAGFPTR